MTKVARRAYKNFVIIKEIERNFLVRVFLCIKIHKLWRRKHVRRGRPFDDVFLHKCRMNFTLISNINYDPVLKRSMNIVHWFIGFNVRFCHLSTVLFNNMLFMQEQFRLRFSTREARLEILRNGWHKLQGALLELNNTTMSVKMSNLIQEIARVPPNI